MKFLTDQPALLIGRTLIIADLHIGIEAEMAKAGLKMPSHTQSLGERIEQLIRYSRAKRLVILGDLKHRVSGVTFFEKREVPRFVDRLSPLVKVELIPGNHDGGIRRELRNCKIKIHPVTGIRIGNHWLTHGHTRLSAEARRCHTIIISHSHPQIEFRDRLGYVWTEPVWVRAKIGRRQLIVMPAFGSVGGTAVNRQGLLGPIGRRAKIERVYLLDGTELSLPKATDQSQY